MSIRDRHDASKSLHESSVSARDDMVERQLVGRGISEPAVLEAMRRVPREAFVPAESRGRAYCDGAMPIGSEQTISQPFMVALMTQSLLTPAVAAGGRFGSVLDVGGGSGYQAAILAQLAERVISIERIPELAQSARVVLAELGIENVEVVVGDGTLGLPERAPFDGILVAAAAPAVPPALREQLAVGAKLVIPVGVRGLQDLTVVHRRASGFHESRSTRCVFVPLLGEQGWREEQW
jgi:protein-L-isoaspartate(D-aspartate) O-methyltransferase